MSANYPLRHTALSADGDDVAVAGTRGLALYSRRTGHWRLFGDVSQERQIEVHVRCTALLPNKICSGKKSDKTQAITSVIEKTVKNIACT